MLAWRQPEPAGQLSTPAEGVYVAHTGDQRSRREHEQAFRRRHGHADGASVDHGTLSLQLQETAFVTFRRHLSLWAHPFASMWACFLKFQWHSKCVEDSSEDGTAPAALPTLLAAN